MEFEFDVFDLDPEYLLSYDESDGDTDAFGGVSKREEWWGEVYYGDGEEFDYHFMTNEQIRNGEE